MHFFPIRTQISLFPVVPVDNIPSRSLGLHVGSHKQTVRIFCTDGSNGSRAAESTNKTVKSLLVVISFKISAIGNSNLTVVNYQNLGGCWK